MLSAELLEQPGTGHLTCHTANIPYYNAILLSTAHNAMQFFTLYNFTLRTNRPTHIIKVKTLLFTHNTLPLTDLKRKN